MKVAGQVMHCFRAESQMLGETQEMQTFEIFKYGVELGQTHLL